MSKNNAEAAIEDEDEEGSHTAEGSEEPDFGFFYWPGGITIINFGTHQSPKELLGGSAYAYFLIDNIWACLLALIVVAFQMYLFWTLWIGSEDTGLNDEFQETSDYIIGLIGASFMLALRVLPHVGRAFELVFMGTGLTRTFKSNDLHLRRCDLRLIVCGLLDLLVAAACVCVGVRYSLYQATSVIRTITIATVAVFIEGIDEQMYNFLDYWSRPAWIRWKDRQLEEKYGNLEQYLKRNDEVPAVAAVSHDQSNIVSSGSNALSVTEEA